jgi:hypothetical protein
MPGSLEAAADLPSSLCSSLLGQVGVKIEQAPTHRCPSPARRANLTGRSPNAARSTPGARYSTLMTLYITVFTAYVVRCHNLLPEVLTRDAMSSILRRGNTQPTRDACLPLDPTHIQDSLGDPVPPLKRAVTFPCSPFHPVWRLTCINLIVFS